MIFILAWRNLWRNRRRTLITAGAIFFAVMLSVVMNSIQQGVYEKMIDNIVGLYSGYVQVHQKGYWDEQTMDFTFADAPEVRQEVMNHPRVSTAVPRLESFALAASTEKTAPTSVVGTDPELEHQLTKLKDKVVAGTFLTNADKGVMVAEGLAEKLGLALGDTLILMGQGYQGINAVGQFEIKALLHFGSPELNKAVTYMPLPEAQFLYAAPDRLTAYALAIDRGSAAVKTANQLEEVLPAETYEVMDWKEMMPEMIQLMEVDQGGNYVTLGILYLVVAFGIFGTVLMMTQERRFEFGLMLSVGMKRIKLIGMTLIEMLFMALLGVGAGILVSLPIAYNLHHNPVPLGGDMAETYANYGFEAVITASLDPSIFSTQAIIVLVLTLLISIYPAIRISRLDPVSAMRA